MLFYDSCSHSTCTSTSYNDDCIAGSSSGRRHNPSPVNYVDNPLPSPSTPLRVVREIANSLQTEASEGIGQSHPAEAGESDL